MLIYLFGQMELRKHTSEWRGRTIMLRQQTTGATNSNHSRLDAGHFQRVASLQLYSDKRPIVSHKPRNEK